VSHDSNLRDNAAEWLISECPKRAHAARLIAAADRIEQLEQQNSRLQAESEKLRRALSLSYDASYRLTVQLWDLLPDADEAPDA
jgi:7-keto-8-aminopelargonate synthetase-like enzyme